ncbi:ADP-sugar pyrophosphatase [Gracilaria domingensis]|nr:ADP-sugar pyrophosphatase [Gracilaria domingensis]
MFFAVRPHRNTYKILPQRAIRLRDLSVSARDCLTYIRDRLCQTRSQQQISAMSLESKPPIASLIRLEARTHACVGGSVDPSSRETLASTKWLKLETLSYRFQHDKPEEFPRRWDVANRTTSTSIGVDAVVILARLCLADDVPRILLVKQFRPPLNAVSVELPAGLVDAGETVEQSALRELIEETGFRGRVCHVHSSAALSPGLSAENVALVEVEIEGATQGQKLEGSENIEVISVPLNRMEEALDHMIKTEGVVVMHAVSTLSVGLRLGLPPL